ncbi:HEPN domain-containing protein [Ferrovibrio sp.]|uniref:HEPN domain-containing protein n=1 Tax=Ferrovibrio sp. TaxID=1917215 RepID=UPI003D106690
MSVSPLEILADAQTLRVNLVSSEARRRSILSRTYYAAFHQAISIAGENGFRREKNGEGIHQQLIGFLRRQTKSSLRQLGCDLDSLYTKRIQADYYLNITIEKHDAEDSLLVAQEVLAAADD